VNDQDYAGGERRRNQRAGTPPVFFIMKGRSFPSGNWSLGGACLEDYAGELTPGALFEIEAVGGSERSMVDVSIRARVLRRDHDERQLAVTFLEIDRRAYAILHEFMTLRMEALKNQP
tara:strand:+ start:123 stop:476 length:354 start_codon:yes stop_codon:yes gene_type:complete